VRLDGQRLVVLGGSSGIGFLRLQRSLDTRGLTSVA
jgi:hypothetical protein